MHSKCAQEVLDLFNRPKDPANRINQILQFLHSEIKDPTTTTTTTTSTAPKKTTTTTRKVKAA